MTATQAEKAVFIDINNIKLSDEIMEGFDPNVNQFAAPPPVKPGLYVVTLGFADEDQTKRWFPLRYNIQKYPQKVNEDGTPKTYEKTRLVGRINDPGGEFDGRRVKDTFVTTGIFNKPTSTVASLIHLFGRGDELYAGMTSTQLRELFESCIAGEPMVKVRTDWEWQGSKESGYRTIKGIENFPKLNGEPVCKIVDPATGKETAGFASIVSYLPL